MCATIRGRHVGPGLKDAWLHGFWVWDWADMRIPLAGVDAKARTVSLGPQQGRTFQLRTGQWWYAENILCELDSPGEWYLDRNTATLYFWPPAPLASGKAVVSVVRDMVRLSGASNITLRGMTIECGRGSAVVITGGANNRVVACTIRNMGNWGVRAVGGTGHGVSACDLYGNGQGGIHLEGGDRKSLTPGGHFADNNHIHHTARWDPVYQQAIALFGVGNRATHNLIHDVPHVAIGFSGNEQTIEYNEIHNSVFQSNDAGAIYTSPPDETWSMRGHRIRYNYLHHIRGFEGKGCVGVYLDDCFSSADISGNIFFDVAMPILIGGGRDNLIGNNMFVQCGPAFSIDARGLGWAKGVGEFATRELIELNYKKPPWSVKYPELLGILEDEPLAPKGNVVRKNVCFGGPWGGTEAAAQRHVKFQDNLIGVDPRFVGKPPADFRLAPGSPAEKIGFAPIPRDKIGLYPSDDRAHPQEPDRSNSPAVEYPTIDLKKDCGAAGDGVSNDTVAFQKAAALIQKAGGGTLVIPKATYIVGRQTHEAGKYPFYKHQPIFEVRKVARLVVEGNGAVVRIAPGLRYGSFHKQTGEAYHPPKMPFYDYDCRTAVGSVLAVDGSSNIVIRNLELDGNLSRLVVGGAWGDTGRQLEAYGLRLYNNTNVQIDRVYSHHHALDGVVIGWSGLKESDPATPHTLTDCTFEYNGRQGLSWVGGRGITARRCKFNHTTRGMNNGTPLGSAPGAGLDIEAEESVCRDGRFEDCEFANNGGCGVVADSGDGGYTTFARCTFWGTTSWSAWSNKPGLVYEDCNFYGSVVHAVGSPNPALATRWTRCKFEDKPWTDGKPAYGGFLAELNGKLENVVFDACTFSANARKSLWSSGTGVKFSNCTITHKASGIAAGDFQCLIRGGSLLGCRFLEQFPPEANRNWYIVADGTSVMPGEATIVDGPRVRWRAAQGPVGADSARQVRTAK